MSQREGVSGYQVEAATLALPGADPVVVPRLRLAAASGRPTLAPVRLFVGTELAQYQAERVLLWSILEHRSPARSYEITLLRAVPGRPSKLGWATGFSNFRFLVPSLAGGVGKAIYNDVDQIYLADPAELYDLPLEGCGYRAVSPRETSVMLLDCERMARVWRPEAIGRSRRRLVDLAVAESGLFAPIDAHWNTRDEDELDRADAKLYHFTTLHTQPWRPFPERFVYHRHPEAGRWWELRRAADAAGFQVFGEGPAPGDAAAERVAGAAEVDPRSELRAQLHHCGAGSLLCVGSASSPQDGVLELAAEVGVEATAASTDKLAQLPDASYDAALWVVGREGVCPDDVPRILRALFERSRSLVYVCAGCRPGAAQFWWHPPRGSVGTERWWIDQLRTAAARYPNHRWELDLTQRAARAGPSRRLRPGGGAPLGGREPKVWVLCDATPHHERLARALADAVGWPYELHPVTERWPDRLLHGVFGAALGNALRGVTARGLEGTCLGPVGDPWPSLLISAGALCAPRARYLREASGHRSRLVQLDSRVATPTAGVDLVVTPPRVGALAHPRRVVAELVNDLPPPPAPSGLPGLRHAMAARAFLRPGNDRGTTRPQLGLEALFSRLVAEGLLSARSEPAPVGDEAPDAGSARGDVLAEVAGRVRALVTRRC